MKPTTKYSAIKYYKLVILLIPIIVVLFVNNSFSNLVPVFATSKNHLYEQSCKISISSKNNIESVNKNGRIYFMTITNNSNHDLVITLFTSNNNTENNPDGSEGRHNVKLNSKLTNNNDVELDKISLKSNETFEFKVNVTVPLGTQIEHWNIISVKAITDECVDYSTSFNLFTFIPNPNEN
ncbi:MAG: hypothetical protein A2033_04130 [Bacteroidetes bacterium GWA2_31_9]|nr:MAG: hypothetical protein A2033_04130 [Bacteroidetes bacterium GWA2_31_9]